MATAPATSSSSSSSSLGAPDRTIANAGLQTSTACATEAHENDVVITLRSSDDKLMKVPYEAAVMSGFIKSAIAATCGGTLGLGDTTRTSVSSLEIPNNIVVPVLRVDGAILTKVMEYCIAHQDLRKKIYKADSTRKNTENSTNSAVSHHNSSRAGGSLTNPSEGSSSEPELMTKAACQKFDAKYFECSNQVLHDVIMAADFLDIKGLLDLGCQRVADMIKGKSPEDVRKMLNIVCDFSKEELEIIARESKWTEEF